MNNQTIKNDPADRSDEAKKELEKQLRSIWQELVDNYRTFVADIECDIKRVRKLLDSTGGDSLGPQCSSEDLPS